MTDPRGFAVEELTEHYLVGVDGEGSDHGFDVYTDTVYVIDGAQTVEHVEHLQPGALPAWVSYVREKRGWRDLRYRSSKPFEGLVDQLAAMLEPAQ